MYVVTNESFRDNYDTDSPIEIEWSLPLPYQNLRKRGFKGYKSNRRAVDILDLSGKNIAQGMMRVSFERYSTILFHDA